MWKFEGPTSNGLVATRGTNTHTHKHSHKVNNRKNLFQQSWLLHTLIMKWLLRFPIPAKRQERTPCQSHIIGGNFVCLFVCFDPAPPGFRLYGYPKSGGWTASSPISLPKARSIKEACQAGRWGNRAFWLAHLQIEVQWNGKSSVGQQPVCNDCFAGPLRNLPLRNVVKRTYSNKTFMNLPSEQIQSIRLSILM